MKTNMFKKRNNKIICQQQGKKVIKFEEDETNK